MSSGGGEALSTRNKRSSRDGASGAHGAASAIHYVESHVSTTMPFEDSSRKDRGNAPLGSMNGAGTSSDECAVHPSPRPIASETPMENSSRRKSLVALLGKPGDALDAGQVRLQANARNAGPSERVHPIPVPRPRTPQRQGSGSTTNGSTSARPPVDEDEGSSSSSVPSSSRLSTSLSHGVKSLADRYTHSKEANEMYRRMRFESDSEQALASDASSAGEPALAPLANAASKEDGSGDAHLLPEAQLETFSIPQELVNGDLVLKVTTKKVMQRILRIDPEIGQIFWQSKKNTSIPLDTIREILSGSAARSHRNALSIAPSHERRWITVVYQVANLYKTLNFIALSDESFVLWRGTLQALHKERESMLRFGESSQQRQSMWIRQHWSKTQTSNDARLDYEQVVGLCRRLGISSSRQNLLWHFEEADTGRLGTLDFEGFQRFVGLLKCRTDVEPIFVAWADISRAGERGKASSRNVENLEMSIDRFALFLQKEQGRGDADLDLCRLLCRRYSGDAQDKVFNFKSFLAFLHSADNSIIYDQAANAIPLHSRSTLDASMRKREEATTAEDLVAASTKAQVMQVMTRPLSEYYISSSHNTYLVGAQLMGDSDVQGYVKALLQGARSVELDCWDGPNGEPQVTHGRTLTSKVPLRHVMEAIARYAFTSSPFPLILSLEIHAEVAQQNTIAVILKTVLGDKLLSEYLEGFGANADHLPSPQDLMGKILVKAKNLLLAKSAENQHDTSSDVGPQAYDALVERSNTSTTDTTESESDSLLFSARELVKSVAKHGKLRRGSKKEKASSDKIVMSPALLSLLIYTVGVKHRGLSKNETYQVQHMFSLSERSALKYAKGSLSGPSREDLIKHNRTHLTRVYPSMNSFARLSYSANYIPNIYWSLGCQLVALNWQTADLGFEMNQAMFARNGRCGYVLKPAALRSKDLSKSASKIKLRVDITVISAQQLPKSKEANRSRDKFGGDDADTNPFVTCTLIAPEGCPINFCEVNQGVAREEISRGKQHVSGNEMDSQKPEERPAERKSSAMRHILRQKTSVIAKNGFNPIWNDTLSFLVEMPSYSLQAKASSNPSTPVNTSADSVIRAKTGEMLDLCFLRLEARDAIRPPSAANADPPALRSPSHSFSSSSPPSSMRAPSAQRTAGSLTSSAQSSNDLPSTEGQVSLPSVWQNAHPPVRTADPPPEMSSAEQVSQSLRAPSFRSSNGTINAKTSLSSIHAADFDVRDDAPSLGTYMLCLGAMQQGYHHVPLNDALLNPLLFSTLFVHTRMALVGDEGAGSGD